MKAVILCAKEKESMFPFNEDRPTSLLPVAGKPVARHLVDDLLDVGVDEIKLVAKHHIEMFREEFTDPDVEVVEQEEIKGTASAVQACERLEDDFFVVNGDVVVSRDDIETLRSAFMNAGTDCTLLGAGEDQPEKFGVLSITNDQVTDLEEKPEDPENSLVNTGIYVFSEDAEDRIREISGEERSLTEAVSDMTSSDEVSFELVTDYWVDIGKPKRLLQADEAKRTLEQVEEVSESARIHEDASLDGKTRVADDAVIGPGAIIEESYIGKGVEVEPGAHIKSSTVQPGCVISGDVKNSVLFRNTIIDACSVIKSSAVAEESDVRSGTVIRNSFIGARSYIEMNNSVRSVKFVPDARTDLSEISK